MTFRPAFILLAAVLCGQNPAAAEEALPFVVAQADGEQPGVEVPPPEGQQQKQKRQQRNQGDGEVQGNGRERQAPREERNRNRNAGQGEDGGGQGASQRERRRQVEEELRRNREQRQKQREERNRNAGQGEDGGGQGASQRERRRQAEEELRRNMEQRQKQREERRKRQAGEQEQEQQEQQQQNQRQQRAVEGEDGGGQGASQRERRRQAEEDLRRKLEERRKKNAQGEAPARPAAVIPPIETEEPSQAGSQPAGNGQQEGGGQPQAVEQPQPDQPQAGSGQRERADRGDVMRFLRDGRDPGRLSDAELRERAREADDLLADPSLKPNVRERLERERAQAERELSQRGSGQGQPAQGQPAQGQGQQGEGQAEQGQQPQPLTPPPAAVDAAKRLTDQELRQRVREGRRQLDRGDVSGEARTRLERQLAADRGELQRRIGANAGERIPEEAIERPEKAREEANTIIRDTRPARDLKVDDLRERVNRNRALLAVEGLTDEERRDLRRRLAEDRDALRERAAAERREERGRDRDRPNRPGPPGRFDDWDNPDWDRVGDRPGWEQALNDRRPSRTLSERELNRRIRATRAAIERGYDGVPRAVLVERLRDDRRELRRRMKDWRDERDDWWDRYDDDVNISIGIMIVPGLEPYPRPPIEYAEVDDEMLQEWLVAPPTMPIDRRYTVAEIEEYPAIRQAMPGIEIDSIRFGFNQDFVPEEEIGELSRIGEMLEAILRSNPNEVFLIEGHTDAVGSAGYNLDLSRRRAASVKTALVDFFNIDPGALETAGYGEQFLKIPTPDEEPENRRVTIRRITPLVGQR